MGTKTAIEWTDATWNPVQGCSLVSAGCAHCYAMRQAHRFSGPGQPYAGLTVLGPQGPRWTGHVQLVPAVLSAPLRWRRPRRVFVNSMSDLFHPDVPDGYIEDVWRIMARCPQHRFQVLTKRPARMREVLSARGEPPLPHVWLGVSVEDQPTATERIPLLLQTPAAVRFVSFEPLLGPIMLPFSVWVVLQWVIVGGESGPRARWCDLTWIRRIRDQCRAVGVPVFVKQLGSRVLDTGHDGRQPPRRLRLQHRRGGDPTEWPKDVRIRDWPREEP